MALYSSASTMRAIRYLIVALAFGAAVSPSGKAAAQDPVASFYEGKQLKFIIRSAPGGGYDLYSRLLGRHIVRHIPGHPTAIFQNMGGAGGIQAVNYMAETAAHDGTYLTIISESLPLDQVLGYTPSFKANLKTFGWIGNLSDSNVLTYTWHTSPTKSMEDAKKRETIMGSTGAGTGASWLPLLYNNVLGTKFKVVNGYDGGAAIKLAMERGEVEGYGSNPWSALKSASPDLVDQKLITILTQIGIRKEKDLTHVPLLSALATNPEQRSILEFISKSMAVGRPIGTTPGVPADRLAALRKAFDETLVDPLFIEDAKSLRADIEPMSGAVLQSLLDEVMSPSEQLKEKVKTAMPPR